MPFPLLSTSRRTWHVIRKRSTGLRLWIGLYLSPSDMELHPGNILSYNNVIIIAGSDVAVGHKPGINESEPVVQTAHSVGKLPHQPGLFTGELQCRRRLNVAAQQRNKQQQKQVTTHEEEKAALITAGIVTGLAALWWYTRRAATLERPRKAGPPRAPLRPKDFRQAIVLLCGLFYEAICFMSFRFVLMFFSPFSIAITSLGEDRANLSAFRTFVRFVLVWMSISSSSWGLGWVVVCDCGTPWTFLLPFLFSPAYSGARRRLSR